MAIDFENLEVVNNEQAKRFEVKLGDDVAKVEYQLTGNIITFTHTEVPPAYEGRGIAGKMAKVALEYAKDHNLRVLPLCPYIKAYILRHPEYKSIAYG
ncbi:MAG: N-acetyltransferase [Chloroflexota bacterium]|nr:MAG: N-acetyltransferase [Chloroflexota bacterium]